MKRISAALMLTLLMVGCGDGQPFFKDAVEELDPDIDPQDPNTDVNNKFAFNLSENLTLNSIEYDAENDELVINNLPFDGPEGRYDFTRNLNIDARLYESRRTPTTGRIKHYAVYIPGNYVEAAAAVGSDWIQFGYGGANINRDEYALPADGEYVYVGTYAGIRSFDDRSGLELVNGTARILLDINDLDPSGEIQGSIVGSISGRTRENLTYGASAALPSISLERVSFNTDNGTFFEAGATTFDFDGKPRDTGTYEGMLAGPEGQEIAAHVIISGTAYIERFSYETVEYELTTEQNVPAGINPFTGEVVEVTETVTTTGTFSSYDANEADRLQAIVDGGGTLRNRTVSASDLPDGAQVTGRQMIEIEFKSDFNAREIGVFNSEQLATE